MKLFWSKIDSFHCSVSFQLNTVWISCEGENPADVENIGPIEYYPRQGFPGYYFPYENSEGYLSPLVAIHFTKPTRKPLILINQFGFHVDILLSHYCERSCV